MPTASQDNLSVLEQELLLQARRLDDADLRRLIAQARALYDLAVTEVAMAQTEAVERSTDNED